MKADLATTVIAALLGVFIAFFVCDLFLGEIDSVSVKTVEGNIDTSLADPNPEVFNYRALNPTVEVYVGTCQEVDASGYCIDGADAAEELQGLEVGGDTAGTDSQNQNQNQNQTRGQGGSADNQENP